MKNKKMNFLETFLRINLKGKKEERFKKKEKKRKTSQKVTAKIWRNK